MQDVMIDLETMGTGPDAAIVAIGAVSFDIGTGQIGRKFYAVVDLASSVKSGGQIDADTVLWWLKQSDEARGEFDRIGEGHLNALLRFSEWMQAEDATDKLKVWGNGAAFDNAILAGAYKRENLSPPWKFWNDRCYRTVKALHPSVSMERTGTHHNALDDAESQALHLMAMINRRVLGGIDD
jgi:hypothetical protein